MLVHKKCNILVFRTRKDLETLEVMDWEVQNRDDWKTVTVAAKIRREL